jgi:hypothetical protein
MNNSIMVIRPYKYLGTWVFDDPDVGLVREPFVAGVPEILDKLLQSKGILRIADRNGFRLTFSAVAFPGFDARAHWVRAEAGGNWYKVVGVSKEGWLCPAMFKYFQEVPKELFIEVNAIS